jgi:hypothetical protein
MLVAARHQNGVERLGRHDGAKIGEALGGGACHVTSKI